MTRNDIDTWTEYGNKFIGRYQTKNIQLCINYIEASHFAITNGKIQRGIPEWAINEIYPTSIVILLNDNETQSIDKAIEIAAILINRYNLNNLNNLNKDNIQSIIHLNGVNGDLKTDMIYNKINSLINEWETSEKDDYFTEIASLARKYESSGDPASISSGIGDVGGASYGLYQFASNLGIVDNFVNWLCVYPQPELANYGIVLKNAMPVNSAKFNAAWRELGTVDPGHFGRLQDEYVAKEYLERVTKLLYESMYDLRKHSIAMCAVAFARSIQNGPSGTLKLYEIACNMLRHPNLSYVDETYFDTEMINAIYDTLISECDLAVPDKKGVYKSPEGFCRGSKTVITGLRNRFVKEKADALAML